MELCRDFKELLALFNAHQVEYMIVGGHALAFHGAPRYTGDIDIYVRPNPANSQRIMTALDEFGFGSIGLSNSDFERPRQVVQLGFPPVRIDLTTSLSGVDEAQAFAQKVAGAYGDIPVFFISRQGFISSKRAAGRKKDIADLEALGED